VKSDIFRHLIRYLKSPSTSDFRLVSRLQQNVLEMMIDDRIATFLEYSYDSQTAVHPTPKRLNLEHRVSANVRLYVEKLVVKGLVSFHS
jgi:hypothetical protein